MFKPATILIVLILFLSGYWFYSNLTTPQGSGKPVKVSNLPWQITVLDADTLRVFDMDIGQATLGQAVATLNSEYKLAWFDNPDNSISLEAYFLRVSLSGLRAKVILELDTQELDMDYLKKNSGKPEIMTSRAIKYPLDDLARTLNDRLIRSLTYVPATNLDAELLKQRFGAAQEIMKLNDNTEFWLYPQKGLVITINQKGKEAFQYVPVTDFERLRQMVLATIEQSGKDH